MKIKNLCAYAGMCAGIASMASAQTQAPVPQAGEPAQRIDPIRIAKAQFKDGKVVFQSDWMDYNGDTSRATGVRVFDCFGDVDSDGAPNTGGLDCGLPGEGFRWYFGTAFCNVFVTNDMTVADDTVIEDGSARMSYSWFWTAGGSFTSETAIIGVFTQDSVPCDDDTFDYSGWLLDYGTLAYGGWYSDVDLGTSGTWTLPASGTGSYLIYFASEVTSSGGFVPATCAQPFLWGTGDAGGAPDNRGTQNELQFDDTAFVDFSHTATSECFSYDFGSDFCPSVMGAMLEFFGNTSDGNPCLDGFANCNGDDAVNTQDFLCFLGVWSASFQSGNYDAAADCNNDNVVNTQDFLCFLGLWAACQG